MRPTMWGAAGAGAWLRRLAGRGEAGDVPLKVEGRVSLGPKKWLVLVNCRGRSVLVAVSGDAITPVLELEGEPSSRRQSRGGSR